MKTTIEQNESDQSLLDLINRVENKVIESNLRRDKFARLKYLFKKINKKKIDFLNKVPLLSYSIKRIIYAFITLYIAIAFVYILIVLSLDDISVMNDFNFARPPVTVGGPEWKEWVKNKKTALGLDGSLLKQILIYWRNVTPFIPKSIRMPLRVSHVGITWGNPETKWFWLGLILNKSNGIINYPVMDYFKKAIPISFQIGVVAVLISYIFGVPIGILAAKNKEKPVDNVITWWFLILISTPATILISVFWLIGIKYLNSSGIWGENNYTNFLAIIAVALLLMPPIVIDTRRYVIDEMSSDYVKFAQSKGLGSIYIFYVHIFRNAGVRIIRLIPGVLVISLFGSSILVERFWAAPGMSQYILKGVSTKDVFVVLGYITLSAYVGVFSSLIGDLILVLMDPRVKLSNNRKE
ncbi:oligopeptide ABC transporter permease [Spiroplasma helicoides]|uniref:Oligopeptide ABC transporter permease n=1 Tax=Spiroplasma helicoides TaxID=216938 RepID=A0A1B3SLU8_9MOLU|nr:oligopeptide ABC transporter permease OppB [Spiroplasma helicoides]AOG60916.1 oligopeptide ABC transporter permease [Spiroplasma helicoides]